MKLRRAKRGRRGFAGGRFARIEPLETRIALDGSGAELGRIDADDAAVIRFDDDVAFEYGFSPLAPNTDSNVRIDDGPISRPVNDVPTFADPERFDHFYYGYGLTNFTAVPAVSTVVDVTNNVLGRLSTKIGDQVIVGVDQGDRVSFGLEQNVRAREHLLGSNKDFGSDLNDDRPLDRGRHEVSASNAFDVASDIHSHAEVSDRIPLDDPVVIPVPNPFGESLPLGTIANRDVDPSSFADAFRSGTQQTREGLSKAAGPQMGRAATISQDQYFAAHENREPVGWSTQSAASQSRQHAQVEAHAMTSVARRLHGTHVSMKFGPNSARTAGLLFAATDQVVAGTESDQVLVSTAADENSEIAPRVQGLPIASDDLGETTSESESDWRQTAIRDLLFAQSQPLLTIVGVSLAAHLISDARSNPRLSLGLGARKRQRPS